MNNTKQKIIGDFGEDLAAQFLMKQGFSIRERNWRIKYGEIDIIAVKGQMLHFVEVKCVIHETSARNTSFSRINQENFSRETQNSVIHETFNPKCRLCDDSVNVYSPEDGVHEHKLRKLCFLAEYYVMQNCPDLDFQIDVVAITLCKRGDSYIRRLKFYEEVM